ncbi:Do family serine endopeptidase [Sandaracinobacter sp. RS1-74]|uniref:Do family serine endopeptidase n=1 Tax=Sandaracinobacteroides sayramensis TaxID=2913411 RepID=UPI001EDB68A8|nr:Do family serine endopeptidase [Sandaracinobacteroides sayramensis]MCG2839989.1 Do family serine endopeptidase [Sandaracinobacteroides sayramensis]
MTKDAESQVTDSLPQTNTDQPAPQKTGSRRAGFLTAGLSAGIAAVVATAIPVFAQTAVQTPAQNPAAPAAQPAQQPLALPPRGAPMSFADLTAKLQPAVVNISTTQRVEVGRFPRFAPGTNIEDLFRRFQEQQGDDGQPVTREAQSLGSGFLISADGYIVTNNHVISGRDGQKLVDTITVTLSDRREYTARVIGRDPLSDLALLKIDGQNLPYVQFGNSEGTRVGDWAIAIGNPFGLGGTVTAGIVSALHRGIQGGGAYDRYIQTDASINQGNSGGPLFDLNGNVIGVNTAIFSPTGGNVGVGFAIPAELAQPVIEQLRTSGKVRRGYLGVQIQNMSPAIAASLGLPKDRGEIIASVEPGGPARAAGLQQGDVVVKVAGQDVTPDNNLSYIVANTPIGSRIPVEVIRGGKRQTLTATIGERPSEASLLGQPEQPAPDEKSAGSDATRKSLGITLQAISPEIRRQLRLPDTVTGVVIADVNPSSNAAEEGLQRGDIIVSVNQQPVSSPQQAADAVAAARKAGRDTVLLFVQRGNAPGRFVGVKVQ